MHMTVRVRSALGTAVLLALSAGGLAAQGGDTSLSGRVTNQQGEPVASAQIIVTNEFTGVQAGQLANEDGRFTVNALRPGRYRVEARSIGYGTQAVEGVRLESGQSARVDFVLTSQAVAMDALEVFSERAVERQTPFVYTNVEKAKIQRELASQDIPMVLNTTPSVYATMGGGGAGDARVNVRGFNQRNVAVMINGVPINDMENGWVYWSNWDGLGDASQSIQLQRGLSAINLATPSIGGTLNIITDPAVQARGMRLRQEVGNDGFLKTTVQASTGVIDDRFAFSAAGVRKVGDGVYDGTWTDAWAYYGSASYKINDRNRVELYAIGAPQRHGQNLYKQNIAAYDHELARELGYSEAALAKFPERGRRWNENYNTVSCNYSGLQSVEGETFERHDCGMLNERENFYHKPQVNLNWYSQLTDRALLSTVAYYSGGEGGGTGTAGSIVWDYNHPSRIADWDATIARNAANGASRGILRNSRNNQWTIGGIAKLDYDVAEPLNVQLGVDWRTAEIEHYREVRDLLGGTHFVDTDRRGNCNNQFDTSGCQRRHGDKIAYDFTNTVDWVGGYLQAEYRQGALSARAMGGLSTIGYTYTNHFRRDPATGGELYAESGNIGGYQIKGGALYSVGERVDLFGNAGFVSKVPIFDGVIDDFAGEVNPDPKNETFLSFEGGLNFRASEAPFSAKLSLYRTDWRDRTITRGVTLADGTEGLVNLLGLDALHQGIELELAYQPVSLLRFDVAASIGDWTYTDDVSGSYRPDDRSQESVEYSYYIKDLKVGDAPQTQVAYSATVYPSDRLYVQAVGKSYGRHFADFSPLSRTDPTDRGQSWQPPGYTVFDLHLGYDLRLRRMADVEVFAHVMNVLDNVYIQDAVDNSRFNAFKDNGVNHSADDAEVYLGLPRTFNIGVSIVR